MDDRDKVISNLQILRTLCVTGAYHGIGMNHYEYEEAVGMLDDALELLKAQEAVVPVLAHEGANKQCNDYKCPECHTLLYYGQRYCEWCGKKVDWD